MKSKIRQKLIKEIYRSSLHAVSIKIKVPYATLYRLVKDEGGCTMKTWNKIEKYYKETK